MFRNIGPLHEPSLPDGVQVESVASSGYKRHVSLSRIKYEILFGRNFKKSAIHMHPPDLVVLADPSLFYAAPVLRYAKTVNAKIVLDVLDLWPEQFEVVLPSFIKRFGRSIFAPLYLRRRKLVDQVNGVVAVSNDHLNAINPSNETPSLVAYLGVDYERFLEDSQHPALSRVESFVENADLVAIYAGTLGETYDIPAVLRAAEKTIESNRRIKFIFAGEGPLGEHVQSLGARFPKNVLFLGKIAVNELPSIYKLCHVGLCSYRSGSTVTMPVKLYDYLAGGLFVIYSIGGEIRCTLADSACGHMYEPGNAHDLSRLILDRAKLPGARSDPVRSNELARSFDARLQHDRFARFLEQVAARTT